jgi:dTDP-4-amino-4,6-dideoxygalactose transaminase
MAEKEIRRIPRYDLVTPMLPCKEEIMAAFERFLLSGHYILGEEVHQLEQEMARLCEVEAAVGVSSGSSALYLALAVAGVGPGSEVITTPYTFVATIEAIVRLGATPVLVDIRPEDLNLDPDRIEAAITERTRAILPVHIFGVPCDMHPIMDLAERRGLDVVVDMAQAFGTLYAGRPCGSYARLSSLSFYPTKNLPGIGDGGLVLCRRPEDAESLRRLRGHDPVQLNGSLLPGFNYRLDEIQAMIIRRRLSRFADEQRDRDRVAAIYSELIPPAYRLAPRNGQGGLRVTHHQYWVRTKQRDPLRNHLEAEGIETGIYYDPPLHRHPLGQYCRAATDLAEAERAAREILTLPIHPALSLADAARIGELVRDFLAVHDAGERPARKAAVAPDELQGQVADPPSRSDGER